jgi:hypothetical protein
MEKSVHDQSVFEVNPHAIEQAQRETDRIRKLKLIQSLGNYALAFLLQLLAYTFFVSRRICVGTLLWEID